MVSQQLLTLVRKLNCIHRQYVNTFTVCNVVFDHYGLVSWTQIWLNFVPSCSNQWEFTTDKPYQSVLKINQQGKGVVYVCNRCILVHFFSGSFYHVMLFWVFTVGIAYPFPMDCTQIKKNGNMDSGVYTIYVASNRSRPVQVFCDMTTDGGGWVVSKPS